MPEEGTVWLCRAVSLANFNDEQHAYVEFGRLFDAGQLLPDDEEQEAARSDYFLVGAVLALSQARVRAENDPGQWFGAYMTTPDGAQHRIGRVHVDREIVDDYEYTTRFLLLIAAPPADRKLRPGWREFVIAQILRSDDPITRAYGGLPSGTNLQSNELPYVQETMEPCDKAEVDETDER